MSDSTLSDIDIQNKMAWVWTTLNDWSLRFHHEKDDSSTPTYLYAYAMVLVDFKNWFAQA